MPDCPTTADFKARFPEFGSTPDATIQIYLGDACGYLDAAAWGECWTRAVLYYTAHLLTISQRATSQASSGSAGTMPPSGSVVSSSANGLSVSFANAAPKTGREAWYQSTFYGQQFLVLIDECIDISSITGGDFLYW